MLSLKKLPVVTDSEVLSNTIQEQAAIVKRLSLVVEQQSALPDFPGGSVLELGDWTVQKGYGCTRLVVFSHPVHCLEDAV